MPNSETVGKLIKLLFARTVCSEDDKCSGGVLTQLASSGPDGCRVELRAETVGGPDGVRERREGRGAAGGEGKAVVPGAGGSLWPPFLRISQIPFPRVPTVEARS